MIQAYIEADIREREDSKATRINYIYLCLKNDKGQTEKLGVELDETEEPIKDKIPTRENLKVGLELLESLSDIYLRLQLRGEIEYHPDPIDTDHT